MAINQFDQAVDVLRRTRVSTAIDALVGDETKPRSAADRLAAALDTLAEGVKQEAALWEQHKKKGWQSTKASLMATAGKLNDLAKEVDDIGSKPMPTDAEGNKLRDPGRGIEPGGDPNQEGVAPRSPIASPYANAIGRDDQPDEAAVAAHLARLESDAEDARLEGEREGLDESERSVIDAERDMTTAERIEAGLPVSPSAETLTIFSDNGAAAAKQLHNNVHTEVREAMAAAVEDPFSDPISAMRLAKPLTFADLMQPIAPRADVPHWSHSQLDTLDDCGVKYAIGKMLKMPRVPQWSLVGGSALHAAIEVVERAVMTGNFAALHTDTLWQQAFQAAIRDTAAEAPVPPAQWRAANRGAEGFDWWRVEGERMLAMYVDVRRKGIDAATSAGVAPKRILQNPVTGEPLIETELTIKIPGPMGDIPFIAVLDQAWTTHDGLILITDLKSGKSTPTDTFQLGSQALVLAQHMGFDADVARRTIVANYYDARKGVYTEAFSPIERHPFEELVYRVHTAEHQRRTGIYRPRVSPFCNGCAVKYACPLQNGGAS